MSSPPDSTPPVLSVRGLAFAYPGAPDGEAPVLRDLDFDVPRAARCLLVGRNGAGKTTLLTLLAGRHLVADAAVRVLSRPTSMSASTRCSRVARPIRRAPGGCSRSSASSRAGA